MSRFIQHLSVGTTLSIVTMGQSSRLVLPPTVVTSANRESLAGRVPRRQGEDTATCLTCALNTSLAALQDYQGRPRDGALVLLTGRQDPNLSLGGLVARVLDTPVMAFVVSTVEAQVPPELYRLARHGQVFGTVGGQTDHWLSLHLAEVLLAVHNQVEAKARQKIHQNIYFQPEVRTTFSVEYGLQEEMMVVLEIEDETRVEAFEVMDPAGEKHIFSQFESGLVYFRFPGLADTGVWSYRVRLYQVPPSPAPLLFPPSHSPSLPSSLLPSPHYTPPPRQGSCPREDSVWT